MLTRRELMKTVGTGLLVGTFHGILHANDKSLLETTARIENWIGIPSGPICAKLYIEDNGKVYYWVKDLTGCSSLGECFDKCNNEFISIDKIVLIACSRDEARPPRFEKSDGHHALCGEKGEIVQKVFLENYKDKSWGVFGVSHKVFFGWEKIDGVWNEIDTI